MTVQADIEDKGKVTEECPLKLRLVMLIQRSKYFFAGSEGGSEQTRPLKSSSQEPSEPSTPAFDPVSDKRLPPPPQFETQDHIIQIDEPESPSKTVVISKEEDVHLQEPATPIPSDQSESELILSASSLETHYQQIPAPEAALSERQPLSGSRTPERGGSESRSTLASPRSSRVSPAPSPTPSNLKTDKGKSKVTGKVVSGWL